VQSQPVKRVVAGALAAAAVLAAAGFPQASATPTPNLASPPPTTSSDALAQYRQLAAQAEQISQQQLQAQDDYNAKKAELDKANADVASANQAVQAAQAKEAQYQVTVDQFTDESFVSGAQFAKLSTLLSGTSTQDFLDRSSALEVLADNDNRAMQTYIDAVNAASTAEQQAAAAKNKAQADSDAAANLLNNLNTQSAAMQKQLSDLNAVAARLTAADKLAQRDHGASAPNLPAPTAAAQTAINVALGKLGDDYVWGATGPNTFDCSGLMQFSYRAAGVSLPRTAAEQQKVGLPVSRSQLEPGDLVFFGSPAYHVAMYLGDGMIVQAPTTGDVVKVSPLLNSYSGARRVAT